MQFVEPYKFLELGYLYMKFFLEEVYILNTNLYVYVQCVMPKLNLQWLNDVDIVYLWCS